MRHDDVVTFFHEMGHVFHGLLSKTKFARFHGTSVARDFVEAPSQMLENWCFEPKVLELMSSHYETQKPLDASLIDKIIKSRYVNVGLFYLRQLFFANFDLKVHTDQDAADYTELWNTMREEISLVKGKDLGPGEGSFNHIAGGYDAGYYGYMYSLVFASDMYATVFKKDPLDPERGRLYREKILRVGGSRDDIDSLKVSTPPCARWVQYHGTRYRRLTMRPLPPPAHFRTSSADRPMRTPSSRSSSATRRRTCESKWCVGEWLGLRCGVAGRRLDSDSRGDGGELLMYIGHDPLLSKCSTY